MLHNDRPSSDIDIGVSNSAAVTVDIVNNAYDICATAVGSPRMVTSLSPDMLTLGLTCGVHVHRRSAQMPPSLVTATVAVL
jgi:hypothetical protein